MDRHADFCRGDTDQPIKDVDRPMTYTRQQLIVCAALGSALLLGGAFVFQALGYAPCKMCIWQRYPHAIAIAIGALAFFVPLSLIHI